MSHVITGIVQRRKVGSPTRKAVLLFMAGCASDDGTGVWTSKANMADDLEMGRRTVQVCIDDLIAAGLISEVGQKPCRNGFTVEYRLNIDAILRLEPTRAGAAPVQDVHMTRAGAAPQDVQELHINLTGTIHEPRKEPLVVPQGKKPRRRPEVPLPPDWVPSEKNLSDAAERKFSAMETEHEADRFRNHHTAKGSLFRDWDAAWRTWLGNARKFSGVHMAFQASPGRHGQGSSIASIVARRRIDGTV